jgi:transcriptional regulator with XRE-family HTH domain
MKFTQGDLLTLTENMARNYKGALTAKQLAELLNISPKTIFKLPKAGRIPSNGILLRQDLHTLFDRGYLR